MTQTLRRKRERGREASGLGSEDEVSVMREVVWKAMGKGFIYKNARRQTEVPRNGGASSKREREGGTEGGREAEPRTRGEEKCEAGKLIPL